MAISILMRLVKLNLILETDTSKGTYNSGRSTTAKTKEEKPINKYYDVLRKIW